MNFNVQSYHKGVEVCGASPEFWSALSDTQLDWTRSTVSGSGIHLTDNPARKKKNKTIMNYYESIS